MQNTSKGFDEIIGECRDLFQKKMFDYGSSWRVMRPSSVTDQIYIKVNRIRTAQEGNVMLVDEDEKSGFMAIVNYAVIGLIQLQTGASDTLDSLGEDIMSMYDHYTTEAKELMMKKNHDYGEAWRQMRVSSITDMIFQKVLRTKQIEDHQGKTLVSEGLEGNYYDMLNYSVFCLIKMK